MTGTTRTATTTCGTCRPSAAPAVFAARADVVFAAPAHADQLEQVVTRFCAALSRGLADAGCSLVGHIKGTLTVRGRGDLAFHAHRARGRAGAHRRRRRRGREAPSSPSTSSSSAWTNEALPAIVTSAWSRATGAETVWRG